jgi:hypothetical protein
MKLTKNQLIKIIKEEVHSIRKGPEYWADLLQAKHGSTLQTTYPYTGLYTALFDVMVEDGYPPKDAKWKINRDEDFFPEVLEVYQEYKKSGI